jgi:spore coat polysaccharide biosynthesis predicted glycosyltransferase SpsG/GNAT superfamily N-acetyltransferase
MRILAVCHGGGSLGVGHVMRTLALAEAAVAAGHEVVVAGQLEGSFLAGQLAAAPVEFAPLVAPVPDSGRGSLLELMERLPPDVLHVDSYEMSGGFSGSFVLSNMEDGTFGRRPATVVVDPTFGAELWPRPDDGSTWLLRGSRYTPLRRRVIEARRTETDDSVSRRAVDDPSGGVMVGEGDDLARTVLVVMGGTDPVGLAPVAVELLARTGLALEVTVIAVGEHAQRARSAVEGSRLSLNVLAPVDDLASLMAEHDLVVSAAGTSIGELCCLGVPTAAVWTVDNQHEGYDRVVAAGAVIGLGGPELGATEPGGTEPGGTEPGRGARAVDLLKEALTHSQVRADLVLAGRRLVDGLGAWRVVSMWETAHRQHPAGGASPPASASQSDATALVARAATLADSRQLWQWRNDPVTRAGSRSSAEVPWEDHVGWLTASLTRVDRVLLVVEDPVGPVGTLRWDLESEGEWEVSVTVSPQRRGQSLARPLLRAGEMALSEQARSGRTEVTAYLAVVHCDNGASIRLFESSGYVPDLPSDPRGFMRYRKNGRVP